MYVDVITTELKVLPGEQVVSKWEDIQSSWMSNELFVKDRTIFFSAMTWADKAVAPTTAKFAPCLKFALLSL